MTAEVSNVEYNPGSEHGVHGALHAKRTIILELRQWSEQQTDRTKSNQNLSEAIIRAKRFTSDMPVKRQVNLSAGDIFRDSKRRTKYVYVK